MIVLCWLSVHAVVPAGVLNVQRKNDTGTVKLNPDHR